MSTLTLAQLSGYVDVSENLELYLDSRVMWTEPGGRLHLEPIEDEL